MWLEWADWRVEEFQAHADFSLIILLNSETAQKNKELGQTSEAA